MKRLRLVDVVNVNQEIVNMLFNSEFKPIVAPDEIYVLRKHDIYEQAEARFLMPIV
ncbi:hypothetical protein [Wukongibacter baidiensis]